MRVRGRHGGCPEGIVSIAKIIVQPSIGMSGVLWIFMATNKHEDILFQGDQGMIGDLYWQVKKEDETNVDELL